MSRPPLGGVGLGDKPLYKSTDNFKTIAFIPK